MEGLWEFPMTEVEDGDTLEDALERWVFESTGGELAKTSILRSFCCPGFPRYIFFPVKGILTSSKLDVFRYDECKLLSFNKLRKFTLNFPSVIYIKRGEKV